MFGYRKELDRLADQIQNLKIQMQLNEQGNESRHKACVKYIHEQIEELKQKEKK